MYHINGIAFLQLSFLPCLTVVVIPLFSSPRILRLSTMAFLAFRLVPKLEERVQRAVWVVWLEV
jgi:hypothetical protein